VTPILLKIGVRPTHAKVHKRIEEKIQDKELCECFLWLEEVMSPAIKAYSRIWLLAPPNVWDNYILLGQEDLREMKMLRAAQTDIRKAWAARPKLLTTRYSYAKPSRKKDNESQATTQDQETQEL